MDIYKIEDAGKGWIGHWFYFMITSLSRIPNFGKKKIKICFDRDDWTDYQKETFDILKEKIEVVFKPKDYIFIENTKPLNVFNDGLTSFIEPSLFQFLRNLFLSEIDDKNIDGYDKIYIRRNLSHLTQGNEEDVACKNIKRRQLLNESELIPHLEKLGFKCINLEDYHLKDKIRIFHSASFIIGPNGGGMTFLFASNLNLKYIEIVSPNPSQYIDHYRDLCNYFGFDFNRYNKVLTCDFNDNITIDIDDIILYVKNLSENLLIQN
jgi:capsular polysaccharide biosynthesis protein